MPIQLAHPDVSCRRRAFGDPMRVRRIEMTGEIATLIAGWAGARAFCQPSFADLWREKGGSPANAPGLRAFKDRWGGAQAVYPVWERRRGLGRLR